MQGAGGSSGGILRFVFGIFMFIGGGYLLLDSIHVENRFAFNQSLYDSGGFDITSGMLLIPFILGVALIFYHVKNVLGWILAGGSVIALVFGVITSINFVFEEMTAFEILVILVLAFGGLGLFFSSFKSFTPPKNQNF